nr:DUF3997 domain-containing protein [uncultured Pedobacter sp.]
MDLTRYIIASQRPWDSIPECRFLKGETLSECKKAFNKSSFCQYWIIEKKNEKILGPYDLKQFEDKRRQLGIKVNIKEQSR